MKILRLEFLHFARVQAHGAGTGLRYFQVDVVNGRKRVSGEYFGDTSQNVLPRVGGGDFTSTVYDTAKANRAARGADIDAGILTPSRMDNSAGGTSKIVTR
jgi:hypothetical protein